jgi:hypothetical protein
MQWDLQLLLLLLLHWRMHLDLQLLLLLLRGMHLALQLLLLHQDQNLAWTQALDLVWLQSKLPALL